MPTLESKLSQPLAAQGISSAEQVQALFAEVRAQFDAQAAAVANEASWKAFRDSWLARKSGGITLITDN